MEDKHKEKQLAMENLLEVKEALDFLKVDFVLDGGTLLGAYRDNDFCEDDHDDIDLTTLHDSSIAIDIVEALSEKGFELYHYWEKGEKNTAQLSMKRHGLKIDLMFKEVKRKNAWWTVFQGKKLIYKRVPAKYYNKTELISFQRNEFNIPKETEDYLELRYGDWKTPIHRREFSCYTSDKVIVENYEKI